MKRIILLLMMLSVSSFATTYELLVNTPQEVDMYTALFNAIHFFFYGNNQDNYFSLLRLIVIFGAILTVIKATAAAAEAATSGGSSGFGSIASIAAYQVFVVFMLTTMFGKTANIVVRHPESLTVNVTPLIPDIFAYTISFFTRLNYSMTRLAEGTFSSLRGQDASRIYSSDTYMENPTYGMTGLGFAGVANALMNINSTNLNDLKLPDGSTIQDVARSYMKDCVLMPLAASTPDDVQKVLNSKKFFDEISPANMNANHGVQTATLMMKYGSNDYITCQDGYDKMSGFVTQLKNDFPKNEYKKLAGIYYANLINQGDFSSGTFQTSGNTEALISASATSQDVLINSAMNLSALESYKDLGSQGLIAASGESAALTDIQLNGTTTGVFMGKYLPVFASFIFMIMIAAFPFMFAFALMPGGFQILVQFVKTLAWISLWSPMAAILNFFLDYRLMERFKESTTGPLTIIADSPPVSQLTNLSSEAAFMAGLAGYLYLMVPALSWMLVTGSGVMLSNMTKSLGGAFQAHGNAGAVEEAATAKGAAEMKDTSVAEMQYYRSGAKMAAASSEFGAQKNVYGDNFGQMSSDMEKRGTASMAEQRGAGSMMTIDSAMAGGMASGKISGAHTTAMGQAYSGVSDQEFAGAASFEARQSASATRATSVENSITSDAQMQAGANMQARERGAAIRSADDVLKEHGGLDKYGQNKEALAVKGAMSEATEAEAAITNLSDPNKKADIRQGMRNAAEKSIGGLEGSGKNQTTEQAHNVGFQSSRVSAITENDMSNKQQAESDDRLKKYADVSNNKEFTAAIAGVNDAGVSINSQKKHAVMQSKNATKSEDARIMQAGGDEAFMNASVTEAKHEGETLKQKADLTNTANSLEELVATELLGYSEVVGNTKHREKIAKNLEKSKKEMANVKNARGKINDVLNEDIAKTDIEMKKGHDDKIKDIVNSNLTNEKKKKAIDEENKDYFSNRASHTARLKSAVSEFNNAAKRAGSDIEAKIVNDGSVVTDGKWVDHGAYKTKSSYNVGVNTDATIKDIESHQQMAKKQLSNFKNRVDVLGANSYQQLQQKMGSGTGTKDKGIITTGFRSGNVGAGQINAVAQTQNQFQASGLSAVDGYGAQAQISAANTTSIVNAANIAAPTMKRTMTNFDSTALNNIHNFGGGRGNLSDYLAMKGMGGLKMSTVNHGGDMMMTVDNSGNLNAFAYDERHIFNIQSVMNTDLVSTSYFGSQIQNANYADARNGAALIDYGKTGVNIASNAITGRGIPGMLFKMKNGGNSYMDIKFPKSGGGSGGNMQ